MIVANALGETREVERVYPDGSYSCPFCMAAVMADDAKPCPNPMCEANPRANADEIRARRVERARREAERVERDKRSRIQAETTRQWREREDERFRSELADVREAGQCVECFVRSPSHRRTRVRHRSPDFHAV